MVGGNLHRDSLGSTAPTRYADARMHTMIKKHVQQQQQQQQQCNQQRQRLLQGQTKCVRPRPEALAWIYGSVGLNLSPRAKLASFSWWLPPPFTLPYLTLPHLTLTCPSFPPIRIRIRIRTLHQTTNVQLSFSASTYVAFFLLDAPIESGLLLHPRPRQYPSSPYGPYMYSQPLQACKAFWSGLRSLQPPGGS
jgi:hypothetical protein